MRASRMEGSRGLAGPHGGRVYSSPHSCLLELVAGMLSVPRALPEVDGG